MSGGWSNAAPAWGNSSKANPWSNVSPGVSWGNVPWSNVSPGVSWGNVPWSNVSSGISWGNAGASQPVQTPVPVTPTTPAGSTPTPIAPSAPITTSLPGGGKATISTDLSGTTLLTEDYSKQGGGIYTTPIAGFKGGWSGSGFQKAGAEALASSAGMAAIAAAPKSTQVQVLKDLGYTPQDIAKIQFLQSPTAQYASQTEFEQAIYGVKSPFGFEPKGQILTSTPEQRLAEKQFYEKIGFTFADTEKEGFLPALAKIENKDIGTLASIYDIGEVGLAMDIHQLREEAKLAEKDGWSPYPGISMKTFVDYEFSREPSEFRKKITKDYLTNLTEPKATGFLPLDIYKQFEYEKNKISMTDYSELSEIDKTKLGLSGFEIAAKGIETKVRGMELTFENIFGKPTGNIVPIGAPPIKIDTKFGTFVRSPSTEEKYQTSLKEFEKQASQKQKEYSNIGVLEAGVKLGLESPMTMFIPVGFGVGAGMKATKLGLTGASYLSRTAGSKVVGFGASKVLGSGFNILEKSVEPAVAAYFGYEIGKDILSSESPEAALGRIGAFALGIPSAKIAFGTGKKTEIKAEEMTGIGRAKTYGYGKEQIIPYKSRAEAIETVFEQPTIKIATARQNLPMDKFDVRAPESIGDIGLKTPGKEPVVGYFGTITSEHIEPFGTFFLSKGYNIKGAMKEGKTLGEALVGKMQYESRRIVGQPSVSLQTVETVKLPPELKVEIYKSFKDTGKAEKYKEIVAEIARLQSKESGRPVAIPSPKRFEGIIEPENEVFIVWGGKGAIKEKIPVISTKFKGVTKEGAVVVESKFGEIGKEIKPKTKEISFIEENLRFNPKKESHFLKQQESEGMRKTQELYEGKFSLPGEYGQHGVSHSRNIYIDLMKSYEKSSKLQKEFTFEEYKQAAQLASKYHDIVKIGEGETEPFKHAKAASELLDKFVKREGIKVSPKVLEAAKGAILRHEEIQPLSAITSPHGSFMQIVETGIRKPSTFEKAMSNADRRDLARMGIKVDPRNIFDIGAGKQIPEVKTSVSNRPFWETETKEVSKKELYKEKSYKKPTDIGYIPVLGMLDIKLKPHEPKTEMKKYIEYKKPYDISTYNLYDYMKKETKYTSTYKKPYEPKYTPSYVPEIKYTPPYNKQYPIEYKPPYTPTYTTGYKYPRPYLDKFYNSGLDSEIPVDVVFMNQQGEKEIGKRKKKLRSIRYTKKTRIAPIFEGAEKLFQGTSVNPVGDVLKPIKKTSRTMEVKQSHVRPKKATPETNFGLDVSKIANPLKTKTDKYKKSHKKKKKQFWEA